LEHYSIVYLKALKNLPLVQLVSMLPTDLVQESILFDTLQKEKGEYLVQHFMSQLK
jgi:hypothetical protein